MKLADLIRNTRSCRRFQQESGIEASMLRELVDLARLGGSARNVQPLKYLLVNTPQGCARVFPHLGWAGYLSDWPGPGEGEKPPAYIICLLDTRLAGKADCDLGIATQNLLLGATAEGLAGCRIGSISPGLAKELEIPDHLRIRLVLALGIPSEKVVLEEIEPGGDIRYRRDEAGVHHVPKRPLEEVIIR